jgi:hypothetical protein
VNAANELKPPDLSNTAGFSSPPYQFCEIKIMGCAYGINLAKR